ncbi:MAG: DegT/DnrJ/EryC1/StrS family aminotransferase [Desulforhabdus sp.]|jgi:UDP-2-acetamido-2-deoxy-ribo-hexuluronate aminotransferase|nr:DegT/DnrJ/EryC1/StrS family aminotransferase [Desulforhabdus sp.]
MDLLIDVEIVVDCCIRREPYFDDADKALGKCLSQGGRLWLYTGSVQSLDYAVRDALRASGADADIQATARHLLKVFCGDKQWLAALAAEGDVFDSPNVQAEQLIRALGRFEHGKIKLLTRDALLVERYPDLCVTPQEYLRRADAPISLDFIDLKTQQDEIRPGLEARIHRVLRHGQYIMGPEVKELEARLASYTGAEHCISVASGTEALLISLMALGIGPGDEVITTPFTFVATAEVIVLLGATPVFVDIEPDTGNIDARLIEAAITSKTKAIMPVSLYGQPADMDEINAIAARRGNIPVIEDAAQSFGAEYKGRKSGNLSTFGCTSFFPSKPLGCYGDGGAIFTNDAALAQACREIRVHGQSKRYVHTRIGVGGRMDTLQCAIVLAKLERFDQEVFRRLEIGARYNEGLDEIGFPRIVQRPHRTSVFGQYTVLCDNRDALQAALQKAAVPTAVHYPLPLNDQPAYQHLCSTEKTPRAQYAARRVMSLPMSADLAPAAMAHILVELSTFMAEQKRM